MPRRRRPPLTLAESLARLRTAGLNEQASPRVHHNTDPIEPLSQRIAKLLQITNTKQRPATNMLFFVMYDIESNRVRRQIVKYLERQGCTRVQKSIFLADLPTVRYEQIRTDLTEVQACYENEDSILVVPISTDYLKAMKIIGQSINIDVITKSKNTLFF